MKVAEYVVSYLQNKGIKDVFMLSGGFCLPLVDAVANSDINYVCNLHEQAAAVCAEAYGQYTNLPGVCVVTAGPGSTNTITGVASAWLDSIPMIILSGQVQKKDIRGDRKVRQIGFQEIDIVSVVESITKYAVTVSNPADIRYIVEKAWHEANTGRKGPVWIDIPLDIQSAKVKPEELKPYVPDSGPSRDLELKNKVTQFYDLLNSSKRPVILAGNGIRSAGALDKFVELAERLNVPIMTTWKAIDFLPEEHPLYVGRPGLIAQRGANFSQQNSDLFISIGARLDFGQTAFNHGNFARKAKKVIVDIDQAEIDKMEFNIDCPVNFDALEFIEEALRQSDSKRTSVADWTSVCKGWQDKYPVILDDYWDEEGIVNNYVLVDSLSQTVEDGDLLVPGSSGTCSEVTMQAFKIRKDVRVFNSEGLGSMGFGVPAAIGGCIASDHKRTICIDGDGGFMMNMQELETAKRLDLPIKYFILNNGGYVSIRNSQNKHFDKQVASGENSGVTLPDIKKIVESYGVTYFRLEDHTNIVDNVRNIINHEGVVVCEVMMSHEHVTLPRNSTHKKEDGTFISLPMEDLVPLIPRAEFQEIMSISDE